MMENLNDFHFILASRCFFLFLLLRRLLLITYNYVQHFLLFLIDFFFVFYCVKAKKQKIGLSCFAFAASPHAPR